MEKKVLLPKDVISQKLNRDELKKYNEKIKDIVSILYENGYNEYIVQDGEPYANGDLHLGHFLNKTLKDFIVKYKLINGDKVVFSFGWDCHGLPIENKAKGMGGDLKVNAANIANHYSNLQNDTLELFGIYPTTGRFKTMDSDFIEREVGLLNKLINNGYVIKKNKPTWYSPTLKTVLANSEIEYKQFDDESLYFLLSCGEYKLLVWTTTEWTIKGNQAVCISHDIDYVKTTDNIICSKKFAIENELEYTDFEQIHILNSYTNLDGDTCPILHDSYVTDDKTGIVHLCGGHGDDDFRILSDNGIEAKNVVENDILINHIETYRIPEEYVYTREVYTHDYPVDWREGNKVYKVLTEQTYLNFDLDKIKATLKEIKLSSKDRNRLSSTIFSRKDWCISRQREWGVSIPNTNDILDVWFDSGSTFLMYDKPADIYIEGSDQHRGWFQSSIILASMIDRVPTKRIITHGFIVDNTLNKFSKSMGNGGALNVLYDAYNPDVLRLWVLLSDFKNDIVFSEDSIKNAGKQYFKVRNFMRYLYNNLHIGVYDDSFVSDNVKVGINDLYNKFDLAVDDFDLSKAVRMVIDYMNKYSSSLTEDIKNTFYESDINSEYRKKYENDFYYIFKSINKLMFPVMPFLYAEFSEFIK